MKNTRTRGVIADTGFWVASANQKDKYHKDALLAFEKFREPLIVTWPVITEVCHLLGLRIGLNAQMMFLKNIELGGAIIFELDQTRFLHRMHILMKKYADLPMDLADASLVILAEELGHGRILSTDQRDFQTYRWKNHQPFENLLLPDVR